MITWVLIYLCGLAGLGWAYYCANTVLSIDVEKEFAAKPTEHTKKESIDVGIVV